MLEMQISKKEQLGKTADCDFVMITVNTVQVPEAMNFCLPVRNTSKPLTMPTSMNYLFVDLQPTVHDIRSDDFRTEMMKTASIAGNNGIWQRNEQGATLDATGSTEVPPIVVVGMEQLVTLKARKDCQHSNDRIGKYQLLSEAGMPITGAIPGFILRNGGI